VAVGGFSHLSTPWGSVSTRNVQVSESKRNLRVIVLSSYPFKNTVYGDPHFISKSSNPSSTFAVSKTHVLVDACTEELMNRLSMYWGLS
jgi:hypothetical protein